MFIPPVGSRNSQHGYPPTLTLEPVMTTTEASATIPPSINVPLFSISSFYYSLIPNSSPIRTRSENLQQEMISSPMTRTYAVSFRNVKLAKEMPMSYLKRFFMLSPRHSRKILLSRWVLFSAYLSVRCLSQNSIDRNFIESVDLLMNSFIPKFHGLLRRRKSPCPQNVFRVLLGMIKRRPRNNNSWMLFSLRTENLSKYYSSMRI